MNGGSRIRTAALCALAAALAGGACAQGTSPAHIKPAPAYAPNPAGGFVANTPAIAPVIADAQVTEAPGGITDGHRAADVPSITPAPEMATAPPADPGAGPAPDPGYTPAD